MRITALIFLALLNVDEIQANRNSGESFVVVLSQDERRGLRRIKVDHWH